MYQLNIIDLYHRRELNLLNFFLNHFFLKNERFYLIKCNSYLFSNISKINLMSSFLSFENCSSLKNINPFTSSLF